VYWDVTGEDASLNETPGPPCDEPGVYPADYCS
jgi:hypothetical protein